MARIGLRSCLGVLIEGVVEMCCEDVDHSFVGGHHDGRVRDLADQLRAETPGGTFSIVK